ncbi:MAG: glutathione S-transferase family protein [Bradyrhizobium sp.]|nr:glutathione S-transferase family protein [Bradyrhizobium sp.]
MIVIQDFPHGARGLRVAWLCEEMGLPYAMKPVGFPTDSAYRSLNLFGTVPFLQDGDVSMAESIAMLFYVAYKYGPTDLLPSSGDSRHARVLQFTLFGEATLASPMSPLLAERFSAPNNAKRNWSVVGIESRLKSDMERLSDQLGDREFLVGDSLTLADISVVTALRIWMRGLSQDVPAGLRRYCEQIGERPAFKRALMAHTKT